MVAKLNSSTLVLTFTCLVAGCASSKAAQGDAMGGNAAAQANGGSDESGNGNSGGSGNVGGSDLPQMVPPRAPPGSCGLDKPAFCETFDTAFPGGRGGDIDENSWSFARWGHETRQHFVRVAVSNETNRAIGSVFCGKPFANLLMPNDVASCDGVGVDGLTSMQLNEVYDDQEDFAFNSMRIRQMFDFTDRTGTVTFDVDAKVNPFNYGHGWWVEFWITEDPSPMPYHEAPGIVPYPRNGLGINLQGLNTCTQGREATEVARVFVSKDYKILHDYPGWGLEHDSDQARCFKTQDQKLNRIKILVNKDKVEVWASDFDDPMNPHRIAVAPTLDLPFTRGYVHLQHSAYNARKDGNVTGVQTYRWDNIGFDGPSFAVPRAYPVVDNTLPDIDERGGHMYGYRLNNTSFTSVALKGVDLKDASSATFDLNTLIDSGLSLLYRFNGGPTHTFTVPKFDREGLRSFSLPQPISELVSGDNTLELKTSAAQGDGEQYVGNMELSVTATE